MGDRGRPITVVAATSEHVALIREGLAGLLLPPNETDDSIERMIIESHFFYVDVRRRVFARCVPRPEAQEVVVAYWVWPGTFQFRVHLPVLGAACRAIKREIPNAGPWRIWGDFPGEGKTAAERKEDSTRQALEHSAWLGDELSDRDADNPKMRQGQSTLDAVIAAVETVEA